MKLVYFAWVRERIGLAEEIVELFLTTEFEGGRHARRVAQITELDADF